MSTLQFLTDAVTRHQIYLQRYAASSERELLSYLIRLNNGVRKELKKAATITSNTIHAARIQKLYAAIRKLEKDLMSKLTDKQKKELTALAEYEADFNKRLLDRSANLEDVPFETTVPSIRQLENAAFQTILTGTIPAYNNRGQGITIDTALKAFGVVNRNEVINVVRDGFALGSTTTQISNNIKNLLTGKRKKQSSRTLARTFTNHVASTARQTFYEENDDIIEEYQVVATLDSRTTKTCGALDGKRFPKETFKKPPYHWNCRSTFIAVVKDEYNEPLEGDRPAKTTLKDEKAKDSDFKSVGANTKYGKWIKRQSKEFKEDVLGKNGARLLDAGMEFDQFVDNNYRPLSLAELRKKDDLHVFFDKAGL